MKKQLLSHTDIQKSDEEFEKILQENIARIKNVGDKPICNNLDFRPLWGRVTSR